jgi:hypothetical protein
MRIIKLYEEFNYERLSIDELRNNLIDHGVPVESWGTGNAKTLNHLFKEIQEGECYLSDEGEYLTRYIEFIGVKVYYQEQGKMWFLNEDRQEFNDGRVRRRKMPSSVSEKMKSGEDPLVSAIRGIEEELGVKIESSQLSKRRDFTYNGSSVSYPGLSAKYKGHQYSCYLNKEQFNVNGYIEIQKDKKTFFVWEEL